MKNIAKMTIERGELKRKIADSGMNLRDLASACGLAYGTLKNQISLGVTSRKSRLRIEEILGPIWCTNEQFNIRQQAKRTLGFDPWIVPCNRVRRFLKERNVPGCTGLRKAKVLEALVANLSSPSNGSKPAQ